MQILKCNLFEVCKSGDAICVTTNAIIKKDGKLVMGAGVAKDFKNKIPNIDVTLGKYVSLYGNRVFHILLKSGIHVFSFPTKHNWRNKSDLDLIEQSCIQLKELVTKFKISGKIYLPAPGCSNGGLDWETEVKPIIEKYLVDEQYIICFKI